MALFNLFGARPSRAAAPERSEPSLPAPAPAPAAASTDVRAAVQSGGGGVTISTSAELEAYLRGNVTNGGVEVSVDTALRVGAVFACVRLISGAVANMPLHLMRRVDADTREEADDHALTAVLRYRPNAWQTPSAFRRLLTVWALLRGHGCAQIVRARGRVIGLNPLMPDRLRREQGDDLRIRYLYRRRDGREQPFDQADVFDIMGMSLDGVHGVSVIRYARETVGLALEAERHGAVMFGNGAAPPGQIKVPGHLGNEGLEFIRASLDEYRAGGSREGKWLVLEEGAEAKTIGLSNEDAQYIETRRFSRGDIAMFFGVPPHMIGDTDKATSWGTGLEQQGQGFVAYTLQDWLTAWEESIRRDLIAEAEQRTLYARHRTAGLVRGSIKDRYAAYAVGRQWGWLSANDVRRREDENPIDDPKGDSYADPPNQAGAPAPDLADDSKPKGEEGDA